MNTSRPALTWIAGAVLATGLLAGCNRTDGDAGTTAGTTPADRPAATVERSANTAGERARDATADARQSAGQAADSAKNAVGDAAITTAVNAALAADSQLSALQINVDTQNGKVLLKGSAPNADAKTRATTIAQNVSGVVSVENQLQVQ